MQTVAEREQAIRDVTDPLPGSISYTNERPLNVPGKYDRWQLLDFLCDYHPHLTRATWGKICQDGLIRHHKRAISANEPVRSGQQLTRLIPDTVEPPVNANLKIVSWKDSLIVFNKPAPLPIHPCGRFNKNSMTKILALAFPEKKLRPAHRLDANTTGLIIFSDSREVAQNLQRQFEQGQAKKSYLCKIHGQPQWESHLCSLPVSRQTGHVGTRVIDEKNGLVAQTRFNLLQRNKDGTSLLEAIPITGRTNQIRVHLWQMNFPIFGDPTYLPNHQQGIFQTMPIDSPPMMLHCWKISIEHPILERTICYQTPEPEWV